MKHSGRQAGRQALTSRDNLNKKQRTKPSSVCVCVCVCCLCCCLRSGSLSGRSLEQTLASKTHYLRACVIRHQNMFTSRLFSTNTHAHTSHHQMALCVGSANQKELQLDEGHSRHYRNPGTSKMIKQFAENR